MKLESISPMLRTPDLRRSVGFYEKTLGFRCVAFSEEWGWASLERDGVTVMLALPNAHQEARDPVFTGSLYFRVDDVEAFWGDLRDRASVVYPLERFDYGMLEFAILDDNGYLLQFGQELGS